MSATENVTDVERLAELVREAEFVVALTGAGISVPSGIPDFRSPGTGLWENVNPMEVAHIDAWRRDPSRFWSFYGHRFHLLKDKKPNGAHMALAELERRDHLDVVVTQNIDRLHEAAGTEALVEVHGTISHSSCLTCGEQHPLDAVAQMLAEADDDVPRCSLGHPLKPDVVLFGEMLPEAAMAQAIEAATVADLMLCIGSSLEVYPVAGLPELTLKSGGRIAVITQGPTSYDADAAVRLGGDVVDDLQALLAALG